MLEGSITKNKGLRYCSFTDYADELLQNTDVEEIRDVSTLRHRRSAEHRNVKFSGSVRIQRYRHYRYAP